MATTSTLSRFVLIAAGYVVGCGSSCPVFLESAFDVTVVDTNGNAICDAVVAASGPRDVVLQSLARGDGGCIYQESDRAPAGSYTVTATAAGYEPASQAADVADDRCGQSSVAVTLTLHPSGP
jgi:hypothetical protein